MSQDTAHRVKNISKLAQKVLLQWQNDGMPDDFTLLDIENPSKGTWKDFWKEVSTRDQDFIKPETTPNPFK